MAELQFQRGASRFIHQSHRAGGAHQQIDALGQVLHLFSRGGWSHGEVIEALGRQALEAHPLQAGEVEVGMEPEAERHRRLAAVGHRGGDLQGARREPHLHAEQEGEGVGLQGLRRVGQLQENAAPIGQGFHAPGQLTCEAVLTHRERSLGQGQLVVR